MKKTTSILLVLILLFTLSACNAETPTGGTVAGGGPVADPSTGPVEIAEHVKAAMDASNHLSGTNYLLAEDGTIITIRDYNDDFAKIYAQIPSVKKISVSSSEFSVFALTEEGDLYFKENKIGEGVQDIAYATTNTNEEGFCILNNDIRYLGADDKPSDISWNVRFHNLLTEEKEEVSGAVTTLSVDKHDFLALNEEGRVFIYNNGGHSEGYDGLECFGWKNMAMVDVAKVMESGEVKSLTVAGIQADGTVLACGTYAQDILSWGDLSYLAMSDGMIVGLTTDGTLKMTGERAESMASVVESWSGIVAVAVGTHARLDDLVTAMDADGNFYFANYTHNRLSSHGMISVDGGSDAGNRCFKFTPDGKAYRTGENGAWEEMGQ